MLNEDKQRLDVENIATLVLETHIIEVKMSTATVGRPLHEVKLRTIESERDLEVALEPSKNLFHTLYRQLSTYHHWQMFYPIWV